MPDDLGDAGVAQGQAAVSLAKPGILDLNALAPPPAGTPAPDAGTPNGSVSFDPAREQEQKRGEIALWLIWTLVGVVVFAGLSAALAAQGCWSYPASCKAVTEVAGVLRTFLELVFAPLVGLVGAVTGFYFGGKTK